MSRQVSRGSAGEYHADEQAALGGSAGEYQADEQAGVARLSWRVSDDTTWSVKAEIHSWTFCRAGFEQRMRIPGFHEKIGPYTGKDSICQFWCLSILPDTEKMEDNHD